MRGGRLISERHDPTLPDVNRPPKAPMSRRTCLRLFVIGAGASLAACGSSEPELVCTDTQGLTGQEAMLRTTLQYTDHSPHSDKTCTNCQLHQGSPDPATCGRCTVLKGPVHPQGYCTSWALKQT